MKQIVSVLTGVLICFLPPWPTAAARQAAAMPTAVPQSSQAAASTLFTRQDQAAATQKSPERALLDRYCVGCHNQRTKTAGLTLDAMDVADVAEHAETWEKVVRKLRGGLMPPTGMPRPDDATRDGLVSYLETAL